MMNIKIGLQLSTDIHLPSVLVYVNDFRLMLYILIPAFFRMEDHTIKIHALLNIRQYMYY